MKTDTTPPQDNLTQIAADSVSESDPTESAVQDSLLFYVSHPGTPIEKDSMPFSALVNVQQRENLLAYLRTVQGSPIK